MAEYDWLRLDLPEHREYLLREAEELAIKARQIPILRGIVADQDAYIEQLEKQIRMLHKTMSLCIKISGGEGGTRRGRTQDVRKDNYRQ